MKNFFLFAFLLFAWGSSMAQTDFILVKKRDQTLRTLYSGNQISFTTSLRYYSGLIDAIRRDSIYLLEYDVRQIPTSLGVYMLDTVATYHTSIYYKDILKIENKKEGFNLAASGASLLGGGILITTVGLGTWLFTKSGDQYHASPRLVIGSAVLGLSGYFLLKINVNNYNIGKKYRLQYITTK